MARRAPEQLPGPEYNYVELAQLALLCKENLPVDDAQPSARQP